MVTPGGCVVDVHPTAAPASLAIGNQSIGLLEAGDASMRHAAAGAALTASLHEGLFEVEAVIDFLFHTYGDSIEELRDFVAAHWRSTRIGDTTVARARRVHSAATAGSTPRVTEEIRLTVLRPIARLA